MLQDLIGLNIIGLVVASISMAKMVAWSEKTRGVFPGRKKLIVLATINLAIWLFSNLAYFYFRAHPNVALR